MREETVVVLGNSLGATAPGSWARFKLGHSVAMNPINCLELSPNTKYYDLLPKLGSRGVKIARALSVYCEAKGDITITMLGEYVSVKANFMIYHRGVENVIQEALAKKQN